MILKEKDFQVTPSSARQKAGLKQEQDVAFYLRRAFKNREDVLVINDLRIEHDNEVAQVDHLIISEIGFCLIESKSLKAEININEQGEWTRKFRGQVTGIKSPIKQVEMQADLLKALLTENKAKILGKVLGLMQQGVGGREWQSICAVSSDAVIHRDNLNKDIDGRVMKSEFVADWVDEKMTFGTGIGRKLRALKSDKAKFSNQELHSIGNFLLDQHRSIGTPEQEKSSVVEFDKASVRRLKTSPPPTSTAEKPAVVAEPAVKYEAAVVVEEPIATNLPESDIAVILEAITCKSCKSDERLKGMYGKFGYFVKCACGANTSMKRSCPACGKNMKIAKSKAQYSASCECGAVGVIFEDKENVVG